MLLPGEPDRLLVLPVRGVLLPALHLALLGLLEVGAGHPAIALRSQHLPPSLLSTPATGGAAGAPGSPASNLAVVHSTILLEVMAAVSHLHAAVVAVASLCVEVEDDAVGVGVGAHLTVRVLSLTAFPGSPAAPQKSSRQSCMKS